MHTAQDAVEHRASTAHLGAWLGLIGTGFLFLMRALDVWLEARKSVDDQPGKTGGDAIREVFQAAAWLEVSWFLIVPLALNAFVLCPIILKRTLGAKAATGASRVIAVLLAVGIAAYLVSVWIHNR
jgi:hypothetical protein